MLSKWWCTVYFIQMQSFLTNCGFWLDGRISVSCFLVSPKVKKRALGANERSSSAQTLCCQTLWPKTAPKEAKFGPLLFIFGVRVKWIRIGINVNVGFKKKFIWIILPLFKTILFSLLGETHFQQSKSLGILWRGEPVSSLLDSFEGGGAFKYHQQNHKQELG